MPFTSRDPAHRPDGAIAIANYDFRASGTVAKSIEIAAAAVAAGLPAQLWTIRAEGPLLARVPQGVPIVEVGTGKRRGSRDLDLVRNIPALAHRLKRAHPRILLSGGNHFHLPARLAVRLGGMGDSVQIIMRASNSAYHGQEVGRLDRWAGRLKYHGADMIVAVSQELAQEVRASGVRAPVRCIPNGVDLDRVRKLAETPFCHPFMDRPIKGPLLVSMGRIVRQKGFDILIRALAMLPGDCPARLILIGDGEAASRAELEQLADALGVSGRIAWLGYQPNPFAIMSRCDLFVSASRWEGASNTLLEALALGLPLVATDCPTGNREVVERGPFGTIAPNEDPAGLADAIRHEWVAGRSREAQRAGADHWAIEKCLSNWLSLLAE